MEFAQLFLHGIRWPQNADKAWVISLVVDGCFGKQWMMVELELAKDAVGQVSRGIVRYGTPNGSFTRFKSDYPRNGL